MEKLIGSKLPLGNGTDGMTDIYKIKELEQDNGGISTKVATTSNVIVSGEKQKKYQVVYYGKTEQETTILGLLNDNGTEETVDTSIFDITGDGVISIKKADDYYSGRDKWNIEKLIVPEEVDGVKVVELSSNFLGARWYSNEYDSLKEVVLPLRA